MIKNKKRLTVILIVATLLLTSLTSISLASPEPYPQYIVDAGGPYISHNLDKTVQFNGFVREILEKDYEDGYPQVEIDLTEIPNEDWPENLSHYTWFFGDGESYTNNTPTTCFCTADHTYDEYGTYTATLVIYPDEGSPMSSHALVEIGPLYYEYWQPKWFSDPCSDNVFSKKVWDEDTEQWSETTTVEVGETITFKISIRANHLTNIRIYDYLPSTVEFVSASPAPTEINYIVHLNPATNLMYPFTQLIWSIGSAYPGELIEIIVTGVVKYLENEDFGIPCEFPYTIDYVTKNVAKIRSTAYSGGCNNYDQVNEHNDATFAINVDEPDIKIIKTVEPKLIHPGDCVTYYYNVTNIGEVNLTDVVVQDDKLGIITNIVDDGDGDDILEPGESWYYEKTTMICETVTNIANVTAIDECETEVYDEDDAKVQVISPDINIVKTASPEAVHAGETVTYTYTVTNTGDCDLYNVVVTDDQGLVPVLVSGDDGDDILEVGEVWVYEASTTLEESTTNVGTVTAYDKLCLQVSDDDEAYVEIIFEPGVSVEKYVKYDCTPPYKKTVYAHVGDWVVFKMYVNNTGETPLDITVVDKLPVGLSYANSASPNEPNDVYDPDDGTIHYIWHFYDVQPGGSIVITFRADVVGECGEHINLVNVTGTYDECENFYDEDTASVFVLCPCIEIEKNVDKTVIEEGETVTYNYTVTNTGNCDLFDVVVTDDQGLVPVYVSGDDGDDVLQVDEIWYYEVSTVLYENTVNVGTVEAFDELGRKVSDEDEECVTVTVCKPGIHLKKSVKENCNGEYSDIGITVEDGQWVTFKIEVTNTGNTPLDVVVTDDLPEGMSYKDNARVDGVPQEPIFDSGSYIWDVGTIPSGETVTITFQAYAYCGIHENIANATGTYNNEEVYYEDNATVTVECEPSFVKLVKDPKTGMWVESVETVMDCFLKFKIEFVYFGSEDLIDVQIVDVIPCILEYVDCSANIQPTGMSNDEKTIYWNLTEDMQNGDTITITFDALVVGITSDCDCCAENCVNYAYVEGEIGCPPDDSLFLDDEVVIVSHYNCRPGTPGVSGPTSGNVDEQLTFTTKATDSDGHDVSYKWDFGDGTTMSWSSLYTQGVDVTKKHTYTSEGTYLVKVMAKDEWGALSDWTEFPLEVTITDDGSDDSEPEEDDDILITTEGFGDGSLKVYVENNAGEDLYNVEGNLTVTGGILGLIDVSVEDEFTTIEEDDGEILEVEFTNAGLGPVLINVVVTVDGEEYDLETTGWMFGKWVFVPSAFFDGLD